MKGSNKLLKKSKSMCSLEDDDKVSKNVTVYRKDNIRDYRRSRSRTISDSSVEICVVLDSDSDDAGATNQLAESGIADKNAFDGDMLQKLEQKIDRLSDKFLEQCRLLTTLKEEIRSSKTALERAEASQSELLIDLVKKSLAQSGMKELGNGDDGDADTDGRARTLLNAIEARQGQEFIDNDLRNALASFLQSDELKEHMVAATAESVKDVIGDCLSRDLSALYMPILDQSHRRLVRQVAKIVEDAFIELEQNSACMSKSVYKIAKSLRRSIERHQNLLEAATDPQRNLMNTLKCTVEELLHKEMRQWRQKVLDVFSTTLQQDIVEELTDPPPECAPTSPPQPADPDRSIIDQMMIAALISKQIQDGDVNAAFERALSAADLSLVTAACRGAEGAHVFSPRCRLHQHVLLALLQQLSTDMIHDTQLKCRYLEDSIINLDCNNELTRAHLPLVIGEVRKHLRKFLSSYPGHVATRRVALIVMAADNLLK